MERRRPAGAPGSASQPRGVPHLLRLHWHPPRDRFRLEEESEVAAPACFRIGAGHIEPAEGVHTYESAGALPIEVEIADEELVFCSTDLVGIVREDGAGET